MTSILWWGKNWLSTWYRTVRRFIISPDWLYCLGTVLAWRAIVTIYALLALQRFPISQTAHKPGYWLQIWYTFDGAYYLDIARTGYHSVRYAFWPLFPIAIKIFAWPITFIVGSHYELYIYAIMGLVLTSISLAGALFFMLRLAEDLFDRQSGQRAVYLWLFFPSAIFLAAAYSESFFLFWATGSFYFAKRRRWWWASVFGAAAAATRLVGVSIFFCLLIEFYIAYQGQCRANWPRALPLLAIPFSFSLYLIYQWFTVGTAWQFLIVQQSWGRHLQPWAIWLILKDLLHGLQIWRFNSDMITPLYDSIAVLFGLTTSLLLGHRKLWSMAAYTLLVTLLPLQSGLIVGSIRYVLVAFPAFLLLGQLCRNSTVYQLLLIASTLFFALLSLDYINGLWVA